MLLNIIGVIIAKFINMELAEKGLISLCGKFIWVLSSPNSKLRPPPDKINFNYKKIID